MNKKLAQLGDDINEYVEIKSVSMEKIPPTAVKKLTKAELHSKKMQALVHLLMPIVVQTGPQESQITYILDDLRRETIQDYIMKEISSHYKF